MDMRWTISGRSLVQYLIHMRQGISGSRRDEDQSQLAGDRLYRPSFVHPGAATVPTMSAAFPGASLYLPMAQSVAVGPLGSTIPMAYYPVGPIYPPGSTVLVEGGYDAGARFGAGATAGNIPPPPPGCPPNAAQLAVMQGANVLVTQRKGNFFMGGSDGGYTIW
ncbi:DAZ-associated protein 2 isoform a [Camelus ferus]|nr:DAZ-associated protein 2 isoform a [Camelus ferus]